MALIDEFTHLGVDCAFTTELTPIVAEVISDAQADPNSVDEARSRSDWPLWQRAMDREMKTLEDAGTWETVPRPAGRNIVGSKWVFRIKRKADGTIDKYKARLVARGFTQIYGMDYFETYSPVAKLTSFRTILTLAAREDWDIDSFDFDGAYLNGELGENEDIYMKNPPSYDEDDSTMKHLKKSLYGLKQAGRKWYDTLKRTLADLGFRVSTADPGVFHRRIGDHPIIIAVHVDDCAITSSSPQLLRDCKRKINERHSITDLGPIHWLLGIKITRDRGLRTLALSQESFIDTIIRRFNLENAKAIPFPITPNVMYSTKDAPTDQTEAARMAKTPYRRAIGSLMYAAVATRPDISYAVSTLSQFLENPGETHWEAVKRVFRYLAGTRGHALTYGERSKSSLGIQMQTDRAKTTDGPFLATHSSSTEARYRGALANKSLSRCPLLKPSTSQQLTPRRRANGCAGLLASCSAPMKNRPHFIATTKWRSPSPQPTISMHEQSISTFVTTSSDTRSKPELSSSFIARPTTWWLTSLPRPCQAGR